MTWREDYARIERAIEGARVGPSGWAKLACPLCLTRLGKIDRRTAFSFNTHTGGFFCFRCGVRGRLRGYASDRVEHEQREDEPKPLRRPDGFAPLYDEPLASALVAEPARAYLAKRVPDRERWRELQLGACLTGFYANRVVVPVLDADRSEWVGWIARSWEPREPVRYRYPPGWSRATTIFNHAALLVETDEPALVVEGAFDAIHLWPSGVAVLGTPPTQAQIWALADARRPIVWVLDGDLWEMGMALSWRLRHEGQRAGFVRLPPTRDPDEISADWIKTEAQRALTRD